MKKCEFPGCEVEIDNKYSFCYEHFKTGKKTDMKAREQWHDDPVVDVLMKMNDNLRRIVLALEETPEELAKKVIPGPKGDPLLNIEDLEDTDEG